MMTYIIATAATWTVLVGASAWMLLRHGYLPFV